MTTEVAQDELDEMAATSRFYAVVNEFLCGHQSTGDPRGYHCCGGTGQEYYGNHEWGPGPCECSIYTDWNAATADLTSILEDHDAE